jgi:hypothetical protein
VRATSIFSLGLFEAASVQRGRGRGEKKTHNLENVVQTTEAEMVNDDGGGWQQMPAKVG